MDIREFMFRNMHDNTPAGKDTRKTIFQLDHEARDTCARFLWAEISPTTADYSPARWLPLADYFIDNILESNNFMHDALEFFHKIRGEEI